MPAASGAGPLGLYIENRDIIAINRTTAATAIGDTVKLDVAASDGDVTDNDDGQTDSGLANVVALATDSEMLVCVALEVIADNAAGLFRIAGRVRANVRTGVTIGQPLEPYGAGAGNELDLKADGGSCCAIALETVGTADAVIDVLFDGIHGFGGYGSAI